MGTVFVLILYYVTQDLI